jgi:hypothetical protein
LADHCAAPCPPLPGARSAATATFVWAGGEAEPALPALHTAVVRCAADASRGDLLHLWVTGGDLASPGGPTAAAAPRGGPVPLLPGASEVARWHAPGWSIAVDRPRLASTALEELALELHERGWRPAPEHPAAGRPEAPEARVFLRGAELCIATLQEEAGDAHLITAYSPGGWATETPR